MLLGQYCQRCINTHGSNCLLPRSVPCSEWRFLYFLISIAEGFLQSCTFFSEYTSAHPLIRDLQVCQIYQVADPATHHKADGVHNLLSVPHHQSLFPLRYPPAAFFPDEGALLLQSLRRINIQNAYFRRQDQLIIISDIVSGRTQTVSVQNRSHHITICETEWKPDRPRAPSWLRNTDRNPFSSETCVRLFAHGSGISDHHCQRQIHTAHYQELQRIIQHGGVRTRMH